MKSMPKLLPVLFIVLIIAGLFFYLPVKREIVYKLGISGDPTTSCCPEPDPTKISGKFDELADIAIFNDQIIDFPKTSLAQANNLIPENQNILGTKNAAGEEKWIEVSLKEQKVRAWEGSRIVMEFPVSSGKWFPTPKGDFAIWYKTRYQRMTGGSKQWGTFYNLPNVPHNMFFYKGFAIHGAYWHNNFGQPMSHGCVNSPLASAAQLFEWSGPVLPPGQWSVKATANNPGTRVFIQ